jgi:CHAD domain-containing protein
MMRGTPRVTTALLNTRARALKRQLPSAIDGDDRGVHQARVATRRLREAVPVLTTGLKGSKGKKAAKKLRNLTRAMGTVRELDVTLSLIDELAGSDDLSRAALQDVRLHVDAERKHRREAMLIRLGEVNVDKLNRRLASVSEAVAQSDSQAWRQALAGRLVKRAKRLAVRIDEAGHMYAPEQLHQVRIAVKQLRYGLELAADSGIKAAVALVRELKRTQEVLGRLHDLQVLQTHVAAVQVTAPGRTAPHEGLAAIAGRIEEQCRLLHGKYVAAAPSLVELTAKVRTDVVARLAQTRTLKMSLTHGHTRAVSHQTRTRR